MALTMDSILKLPTPKKILILVAILIAIAGLYLYALIIPVQDELKAAKGELSKLEQELNNSKAIVRELPKFREQVAKLNEELKNALTQLPNEKEIPEILKETSRRGGTHADYIMLRLPYSVKDLFTDWLKREYPLKASKVISSIKSIRGGKLNSSEWGVRFRGEGEIAETIENLFEISCRKYGLNKRDFDLNKQHFKVPLRNEQLKLFA